MHIAGRPSPGNGEGRTRHHARGRAQVPGGRLRAAILARVDELEGAILEAHLHAADRRPDQSSIVSDRADPSSGLPRGDVVGGVLSSPRDVDLSRLIVDRDRARGGARSDRQRLDLWIGIVVRIGIIGAGSVVDRDLRSRLDCRPIDRGDWKIGEVARELEARTLPRARIAVADETRETERPRETIEPSRDLCAPVAAPKQLGAKFDPYRSGLSIRPELAAVAKGEAEDRAAHPRDGQDPDLGGAAHLEEREAAAGGGDRALLLRGELARGVGEERRPRSGLRRAGGRSGGPRLPRRRAALGPVCRPSVRPWGS